MGGMEWMWRGQEALFLAGMVLEEMGFDSPRFGFDSSRVGLKNGSFSAILGQFARAKEVL